MIRLLIAFLALALMTTTASPLVAKPGFAGINLVNQTGQTMTALFIRRTGTQSWQPLPATPAQPSRGARATSSYNDVDCAFDIKATLDDAKVVVWTGLNLCEVKSLTLNRNAAGVTWADYD